MFFLNHWVHVFKFDFRRSTFTIEKAGKIPRFKKSKGVNGDGVYITDNSLWIKTKDTAISLTEISYKGERIVVKDYFKILQRLKD